MLRQNTREGSLTYAQVASKCRKNLREAMKAYLGKRFVPSKMSQNVKEFAYDLWSLGLDLVEPPKGQQVAPRLRHPDFLRPSQTPKKSAAKGGADLALLKKAYRKFLPQHPSGAVNLFKIRRDLKWERKKFDQFLKDLSSQKNPPFQFVGGDPRDFSADKQKDSLFLDGQLYFSILWRT